MFGSFFLGFVGKIVGFIALFVFIGAIGACGSSVPLGLFLFAVGIGLVVISRFFRYTSAHSVRIRG